MTRGRFNVAAHDRHVSVNVLGTYDLQASLADVEEAIKQAARNAVHRAREQHAEVKPQPPYEQLRLPAFSEQ